MGQNLAEKWKKECSNKTPDIIIPAPSTANTSALSMANALGVRYSEGLYKNPFIGRTLVATDIDDVLEILENNGYIVEVEYEDE